MQCYIQAPHSRYAVYLNSVPNICFGFFFSIIITKVDSDNYNYKYKYLYLCAEYAGVFQNGPPVIKWQEIVDDDIEEGEDEALKVLDNFNKKPPNL